MSEIRPAGVRLNDPDEAQREVERWRMASIGPVWSAMTEVMGREAPMLGVRDVPVARKWLHERPQFVAQWHALLDADEGVRAALGVQFNDGDYLTLVFYVPKFAEVLALLLEGGGWVALTEASRAVAQEHEAVDAVAVQIPTSGLREAMDVHRASRWG